jgi:O-antigen chain-terminating methyltransferase
MSESESEIGAIFARLREEVRKGTDGHRAEPAPLPSRADAERLWSVTAETGFGRRPGLRGLIVYRVKRILHKLMRWYVEPFAAMQREFNHTALRLVDELGQEAAAARSIPELEDRITRLERRLRESTPAAPPVAAPAAQAPAPAGPTPSAMPDYFAFEARMRGPTAYVRELQAAHVEHFRDASPVLDIGCGRGEFLQLLAEAGIEARGIDLDADMVAFARGAGLDVEQAEALTYLEQLEDSSIGGMFCAHVVEHLEVPSLLRLLDLAATKLRPGGVFVAETPNPRTLVALSTFFADLSHVRPLHPETLSLLARQLGFASAEIVYLHEPEPAGRLRPLPEGGSDGEPLETVDENFALLNAVVFGPQDFALVARR